MPDDALASSSGGYLWYQMGRSAAERERVDSEHVARLFGRRRQMQQEANARAEVDALYSENAALRDENARLREHLQDYEHNYGRLIPKAL